MDKETELHIGGVKESLDELKKSFEQSVSEIKGSIKQILDKEEHRRNSIASIEKALELHCKDCDYNRRSYQADLKNVADKLRMEKEDRESEFARTKKEIKDLREAPGRTFKTAQQVVSFINQLLPWLALLGYAWLKKLGVL